MGDKFFRLLIIYQHLLLIIIASLPLVTRFFQVCVAMKAKGRNGISKRGYLYDYLFIVASNVEVLQKFFKIKFFSICKDVCVWGVGGEQDKDGRGRSFSWGEFR